MTEEYEQPETVEVERPAPSPLQPTEAVQWALEQAEIGDLLPVPLGSVIPDGWLKCVPTELVVKDWPEFCAKMGITDLEPEDTFELPDARVTETQMFIIKMKDVPWPPSDR